MSEITFHKMVASGNDFLVIDNREKVIKDPKAFASKTCQPHTGIGADGVLLIEPSGRYDFFMRIINADGSEAEACGNGYRCVGLYANRFLRFPKSMVVETLAGTIDIHVLPESVKVKMAEPKDYQAKIKLTDLGKPLSVSFINTGVPHVVIFTENVKTAPVFKLGRIIRHHKTFKPKGTNVNFVEVTGKNSLAVRTYERGVENETLACGTGTVAAAIIATLTGRVEAPVEVMPKSGELLKVCFDQSGKKVSNVFLEGPAKFVYEGKLSN